MRLYLYVIEHDKGFAPNPFFGRCTLAACKPQIRQSADLGDYIAGFASQSSGRSGHLVYWMRVIDIMDFDTYWVNPNFENKKLVMNGSRMQCYGDNIYHRNDNGLWIQEKSFHSDPPNVKNGGNLYRDTNRTAMVLIGNDFTYWGKSGPKPPDYFHPMLPKGRPYCCCFDDDKRDEFIAWMTGYPERGFRDEPIDWENDMRLEALRRQR